MSIGGKTMEGELVEGIHITLATDVLREFYDGRAMDADREAAAAEALVIALGENADANHVTAMALTKMIGDTRAAQAKTRAATWRFLRENTPAGASVAIKPQELMDLGIRIAKGG